ncbi:hypothetical protein ACLB2K_041511 [Fragaria x ananassa]
MYSHLGLNGICPSYTTWTWHGENQVQMPILAEIQAQHNQQSGSSNASYGDPTMMNILNDVFPFSTSRYQENIFYDNAPDIFPNVSHIDYSGEYDKYNKFLQQVQTPLYSGSEHTVLGTVMKQMKIKKKWGKTNVCFDEDCPFSREVCRVFGKFSLEVVPAGLISGFGMKFRAGLDSITSDINFILLRRRIRVLGDGTYSFAKIKSILTASRNPQSLNSHRQFPNPTKAAPPPRATATRAAPPDPIHESATDSSASIHPPPPLIANTSTRRTDLAALTFSLSLLFQEKCKSFYGLNVCDADIGKKATLATVKFLPKIKYLWLRRARIELYKEEEGTGSCMDTVLEGDDCCMLEEDEES